MAVDKQLTDRSILYNKNHFRIINETLGECGRPKIGWQIDPFGHTREMASIFAHLGFDGVMFARLDYRDSQKRQKEQNMEFVWRGDPNLGISSIKY